MPQARTTARAKNTPKRVLALPDLKHAKSAVLSSLTSRSGPTCDHAIREFVAWYCSEPRLAFNRTVVLRHRIHLEQRQYAPTTINLQRRRRALQPVDDAERRRVAGSYDVRSRAGVLVDDSASASRYSEVPRRCGARAR